MAAFITPPEEAISRLDRWFDPRRAPDEFVTLLATWVGLAPYVEEADHDSRGTRRGIAIDAGHLREMVTRGALFARHRGTRGTMIAMLEIATGIAGFRVVDTVLDESGRVQPYAFRIEAPAAARAMSAVVARIVEREKPAFATAEIVYDAG
jgi:hypothetical protein